MTPPVDRRRFLGMVGGWAGAASLASLVPLAGCRDGGDPPSAAPGTSAPAAASTTSPEPPSLRAALATLGAAVREVAPDLAPLGPDAVDLGGTDDEVATAVAGLAPAMRRDFADGAVVEVAGWRISVTEARLALAA